MEIKGVTENFSDRSSIMPWTPAGIQYTMDKIEAIFEECDIELTKAEMPPLGYEKQPISIMIEHMVILIRYVSSAHSQCYSELDHPLYVGFKNGATEILSNIILEDITTDNTFEMQRYVEVYDVNGHYYRSKLKKELTMADFLGLDAVVPEEGMPVIENVETIGWFVDLFRADYENMGAAVESLDQMLEIYLYSGEYSHKEYHPIGNLISGILDVTIIKPFIESIYGHDLITGEQLTDFERGMQLVNTVVGAVTFGQGALALNFAEMGGKEIAVGLLKIWAVDALSDMSAYTVGYACDALGMPAGVTFLASLATGCTVSVKAGGYVFTDSSGKVVKELDADGMQAFLKELDVDLADLTGGKPEIEQLTKVKDRTAFDYYMDLVETLDVSTLPNTATFYSGKGNRELAMAFAELNGKVTLEMTPGGAYLDSLDLFGKNSPLTQKEATEVWEKLSARYAQGASGNAYGFVKEARVESIFNTVEYPELLINTNITNIFTELMN